MKLETRSITHGWVGTPKAGVGDREMRIVTGQRRRLGMLLVGERRSRGGGGQPCEPPKTREERWGGEISLEMKKRSSGGGGGWGVRMASSARCRRRARGLGDGAAAIHMCRVDHLNGSDVFFFVGGETFHAHRALLAVCSPVFKALLLSSTAEAAACSITLNDIKPAMFEALLHFMYTGDFLPAGAHSSSPDSSDTNTDTLHRLLAAAHEYKLDRLKLMCARKLEESLSVETVARTLGYAKMCGCSELKSKCLDLLLLGEEEHQSIGHTWLLLALA